MRTKGTMARSGAALALLVALTACATKGSSATEDEAPARAPAPAATATTKSATAAAAAAAAAYNWETWPPPGAPADVQRPAPTGEIVEITCSPQGMQVTELLRIVSEKTGAVILYDDASNTRVKVAKVQGFGTWRVQSSGLIDMCRAALFQQNLMMIPLGAASGGEVWSVVDQNNPIVKSRPVWLHENQVLGYADCDGLYVVTSLRVRDTVDTSRVRQMLTALTTQTASIGRIQDVPGGRTVVVGDFAPVVATMKRLVDEVNRIATWPPSPVPTPGK